MKKLFATLLAATMVAGTAVSAFAHVTDDKAANASTKDSDYTLDKNVIKVDNGDAVINVPANNTVYGGDKIYYPILVSQDKILEDGTPTATGAYYYANKASEVDGLKVTLKDVRGGKYIKSANIVRKNLGLATTPAKDATKAKFEITIDDTIAKNASAEADKKYKLTLTVGAEVFTTDDIPEDTAALTAAQIATKFLNKESTNYKVIAVDGAKLTMEAKAPGVLAAATGNGSIACIKGTVAGTNDPTITAGSADVVTNATAGTAATPVTGEYNKIYCVEVALADYFGADETELDFDLELRTRTKEYTSKDNTAPNMSFTLGKDADVLVAGGNVKFRNNELTLKIDKNTGSVKLDEAKETAGGPNKDIEHIFLEGKDAPFTFDVKASDQKDLYLSVNEDANKKVIVSNPDAKMTFVNFPGKPEFDFTGTAKFTVEDPDIKYYFYEIVDDKPVKTSAKYNKEDECFELRTRTLGSYVISDKELEAADTTEKPSTDKPTDKPSEEKPVNPTTPDKNVPTGAIA